MRGLKKLGTVVVSVVLVVVALVVTMFLSAHLRPIGGTQPPAALMKTGTN